MPQGLAQTGPVTDNGLSNPEIFLPEPAKLGLIFEISIFLFSRASPTPMSVNIGEQYTVICSIQTTQCNEKISALNFLPFRIYQPSNLVAQNMVEK